MPATEVLFYQDAEGSSDVFEWLTQLNSTNPKAYARCVTRIERLSELGHELRRPESDGGVFSKSMEPVKRRLDRNGRMNPVPRLELPDPLWEALKKLGFRF